MDAAFYAHCAAKTLPATAIRLAYDYEIAIEVIAKLTRQTGLTALAKCEEHRAVGMAAGGVTITPITDGAGPSTSAGDATPAKRARKALIADDSDDEGLEDRDA